MSYKHLSITEREKILFLFSARFESLSNRPILGRNKSNIHRELKRNSDEYLPSKAQAIIDALKDETVYSITPDRGKELTLPTLTKNGLMSALPCSMIA